MQLFPKLSYRSMHPVTERSDSSRHRFIFYSIYAWGCPLVIGSVTLAMEMLPKTKEYSHLILPRFGRKNCWFGGKPFKCK